MMNKPRRDLIYWISGISLITAIAVIAVSYAFLIPNNSNILFMAKVMGPVTNIYSVDTIGNLKKLTDNNLWRDIDPSISSHGKIVFSSNRYDNPKVDLQKQSENYNVFVMSTNGKNVLQITSSQGHAIKPKISPDEKQLSYLVRYNGKYELTVASLQGKDAEVLATADDILEFSWSPDSKSLCYAESDRQVSSLKTVNIVDKTSRLLKTSTLNDASGNEDGMALFRTLIASAQWSPDGKKIAYIRHPLEKSARQLYVYNLETDEDFKISIDSVQVQSPVSWSGNSENLLYSALVDYRFYYDENIHKKIYEGGMHVFISDLNGNSRQITKGDNLFKHPVFSPDEKQIAFLYADELDARTLSLRIMNIDGTPVREMYNSVAQRSMLAWYQ